VGIGELIDTGHRSWRAQPIGPHTRPGGVNPNRNHGGIPPHLFVQTTQIARASPTPPVTRATIDFAVTIPHRPRGDRRVLAPCHILASLGLCISSMRRRECFGSFRSVRSCRGSRHRRTEGDARRDRRGTKAPNRGGVLAPRIGGIRQTGRRLASSAL
jgi:hypothetical protein